MEQKTISVYKRLSNKKIANILALSALFVSTAAANCSCIFIYHQPKTPTDLKCLRKFP